MIDQNGASYQRFQLEWSRQEWQQAVSLKQTKTQPGEPPTHGCLKNWLCAVFRALCVWGVSVHGHIWWGFLSRDGWKDGTPSVSTSLRHFSTATPALEAFPEAKRRTTWTEHEVLTQVLLASNVLPGGKSASGTGPTWAGVYAALRVMEAPGWT